MDGRLTEEQYNGGWPEDLSENFHRDEFRCKGNDYVNDPCGCGGELPEWTDRHALFIELLEILREAYGRPIEIISGHRCLLHPLESSREKFGSHTYGLAADLAIAGGGKKMELVHTALQWAHLTETGIGVGIGAREGANRFHVDIAPFRDEGDGVAGWTY